jgi:preprotein translocase subunit SecF
MLQIFKNTNYNFIGYRKIAVTASLVVIGLGIISVLLHGGLNFSIDFAGGTLVQLKFDKPVKGDIAKIRTIVSNLGFGSPEIKTVGAIANNEIQITVKKQAEGSIVADQVREAITKGLPDNKSEMRRVEKVGPKIGGELKTNAIVATILGLIAILIYVGFRFNLPFGVAAVIPLFHDVAITICVFSFLNLEASLTFIAALLTIVGFSINDTIVIFDRIRENVHGGLRGRNFVDIVNKSVNQTLSRTFITSLLTIFMVAALYVLGSESIKDFALALLVGFIAGVYSTVYIASPILIFWHERRPIYK